MQSSRPHVALCILVVSLTASTAATPRRSGERPITFAGRAWIVKSSGQTRVGPGPNHFASDSDQAWVDRLGPLHLAIKLSQRQWRCVEVSNDESLGYGEYRWVIEGDLGRLDPQVVLGLFTYEDDEHEIDFELSRWGVPRNANAQFVVQPSKDDSIRRFDTGKATRLTCSIIWSAASVRGRCWADEDTRRPPLADWTYVGPNNPRPGRERVHANFWLFGGNAPSSHQQNEVVIRSFRFAAAGSNGGGK
jgi:hypothetical protein